MEGHSLPVPSGTSGWGFGDASAARKTALRLHTLSEYSLARTLAAPEQLLSERREYLGRGDVCLGCSGIAAHFKIRTFPLNPLNPLTIMGGP